MHIHEHLGDAITRKEKGQSMIVALHEAPKGFFKTSPPHGNDELFRLARKAAALGFRAIEVGPLADYASINSESLKEVLDELNMGRSVHIGGLFDASKFASSEEEYGRLEHLMRQGVTLGNEIGANLVSVHPPFFSTGDQSVELLLKAKTRFLGLLKEQADFARGKGIKLALESFCYPPFIFKDLNDFVQFVSNFSSEKLGILLDAGHLYQAGISLSGSVQMFEGRLVEVHVHDATLAKDYRGATHLPIGKGDLDFRSLVKCLQEVYYDGWLTLEIRASEYKIEESRKYLEGLLAET
jgi:sugar phosphate isomerase/epimerase